MNEKKSIGLAVASMILGIISLLFGCCFWYISLPAALIGAFLAAISLDKKMGGTGMAIAGLVTSLITLIIAAICFICGASFSLFRNSNEKNDSIFNNTSYRASVNVTTSSKINIRIPNNTTISIQDNKSNTTNLSSDEIKNMIENGDYSLVTPEFKETMDSYEAFCDDYVQFMKDYQSGDMDFTKMLENYKKMLSDMGEWTTKIEEIDTEKLSPADSAYYMLVTLRVSKKLLDVVV